MSHFYQQLAILVGNWRSSGYASDFPAMAEILDWAREPVTGHLRYLRTAQFRALETYWYLRLVEGTPRILDVYQKLHPTKADLLQALGIPDEAFRQVDFAVIFWRWPWARVKQSSSERSSPASLP